MSQTLKNRKASISGLVLGAIGVVYGDIGTSPLYTMSECFKPEYHVGTSPAGIYGILSLIFWALFIVVSMKYVYVIMRADNRGEGGILALMALATRSQNRKRGQFSIFILIGVFGSALFYGDGMITPAISVLSAVEGLKLVAPSLEPYVLPACVAVLIGLFTMQSHGTATVGKLFGPIMVLWFCVLAVLGIINIAKAPQVLEALSPVYALHFLFSHPLIAFGALGAVVLSLTGAEAIYADMGHFGVTPIRYGWFGFVWPALVLNYFGQGALLISNPAAAENPFYMMAPAWSLIPMVILATMATVIASQAVISGAYSITWQAIQLGYIPRMTIRHTSDREMGQIYIAGVNWPLLAAVIVLVLGFRKSDNLAAAYGIAVTLTMVITTILAFIVLGRRDSVRNSPAKRYGLYLLLCLFLIVDVSLFSSNLMKFMDGGWVPLVMAAITFFVMTTWKTGRRHLFHRLHDGELPLDLFVESIEANPPQRVEGTAVFMTGNADTTPHALLHNLKHNKVLHEQVVMLTVQSTDIPVVAHDEHLKVERLGKSFWKVVATFGFKEEPSVPEIMTMLEQTHQISMDMMNTSFFLSRETLVKSSRPAMAWPRTKLFALMQRNAARPTDYFKIPPNRVVEMGTQVEI